jgi:hypothetical protein
LADPDAADAVNLAFVVSKHAGSGEVDKLEQMVEGLVKKERSANAQKDKKDGKATPMGSTVQYLKGIINGVMIPARQMSHNMDQRQLDSALSALESCQGTRDQYMGRADSAKAKYERARSQHKTCRHTEGGERMEMDSRCRPSMKEVKRLQKDAICAKVESAQRFKYCNYQRITDATAACDRAKEKIRSLDDLCDSTESRFQVTQSQCNQIQSMMDNAACTYAVRKKEACTEGDQCYQSKLKTFNDAYSHVQKAEVARKTEWRALLRMQCLMQMFEDKKVEDKEIASCKAKSHSPPSITYQSAPSMASCTIPTSYPGTAEYKAKEFGTNLPPNAKGKPDAGTCFAMSR